jgi:hypothetical protein
MSPDGMTISCHENEVPSFVEAELDRLYGNVFSSMAHFRVYGGLPADTCTYVARSNERIVALLLFRHENGRVQVLNEGMRLDDDEIERFARYVFGKYPAAGVISFHAVDIAADKLSFPRQRHICTEDIVLAAPDSPQDYLASLGKSTRNYVQRYEKKLRRDFPSFTFRIAEKDEIDEQDIRDIARMNRVRMAAKDKVSSNDDEETERIIALARTCGLVGVASIDGRVCAGVIHYRIGANYFMPVIAHDPAYNDYRLGTICCYLSICACLERGCSEYHFMWGQYEYKYRLGGVQRDLAHLAIYRSPLHLLRNAKMAQKIAFDGHARTLRLWLQHIVKHPEQGGIPARIALFAFGLVRNIKRLAGRRPSVSE